MPQSFVQDTNKKRAQREEEDEREDHNQRMGCWCFTTIGCHLKDYARVLVDVPAVFAEWRRYRALLWRRSSSHVHVKAAVILVSTHGSGERG